MKSDLVSNNVYIGTEYNVMVGTDHIIYRSFKTRCTCKISANCSSIARKHKINTKYLEEKVKFTPKFKNVIWYIFNLQHL